MKCYIDGCTNEPMASFIWPWGDEGLVCSEHRVLLAQREEALKQRCVITPLHAGAPEPITLEERVQFHARILGLQEDNDRLRTGSMDLFRQLEDAKNQVRQGLVQLSAVNAHLDQLQSEGAAVREALLREREDAARYLDELRVLRPLLQEQPSASLERIRGFGPEPGLED
jgi:hypothetical protein